MSVIAIVLAAGKSERMGRLKPLLPFDSKHNFLEHIVSELNAAQIDDIIVVVGSKYNDVIRRCEDTVNARFVVNQDFERGQLSSVKTGLNDAVRRKRNASAAIFSLADHPLITRNTYKLLLENHKSKPDSILVARCDERKGHPILIPEIYWEQVLAAPLDIGLRYVMRQPDNSVFFVDTEDKGVIIDLDTPELYEKYFGGLK